MKDDRKICVGVVAGAHGIKGHVLLRSFTEDPEAIFRYKPLMDEKGERTFVFKNQGVVKGQFIASLKGASDRNAAEALRGTKIFVERSALPPAGRRTYYEADLVGLTVYTEEKKFGTVKALHDYGAGAFLEIQPAKGTSFMLPFTDDYVPEIDLKEGVMTIVVPEGWVEKKQ